MTDNKLTDSVAGAHEAAWAHSMREALAEATAAATHGDVPVGAVVVDAGGLVIGRGHNRREQDLDPLAHAEVVALRAAAQARGSWRLDDCTLVVTLEPCAMCAGAVTQSRVSRLVFGAHDEKAGAAGSLWDVVRDPRVPSRVEVISGVLRSECVAVLTEFFRGHRDR